MIHSILAIFSVKIRISTNIFILIAMKTSTAIETYLLKNGQSTVKELSDALGVSKADVRYNLKLLEFSKKVVEIPPSSISHNRGRPSAQFKMVSRPTINNLEQLLNLVITRCLAEKSIDQIAEDIFSVLRDGTGLQVSSLSRIKKTIELLAELGIVATWTAGKTGPQISILSNPYKKENPQPYEQIVDLLVKQALDYAANPL